MAGGPIADWLATALGLAKLRRSIRRSTVVGTTMMAAAFFFIAGIGMLIAALTVWIAHGVGPIAALAIVGGTLIVIAIVIGLIVRTRHSRRPPTAVPPDPLTGTQGSPVVAIVAAIIADLLKERALLPIAVAAAGLVGAFALRRGTPDDPSQPP